MPSGFRRVSRKINVLLGALAALAVLVWLFDWNWVRHPVERYLSKTAQREVRIGDLHVDLGFSLQPTVRLRDVYIENAPWADKRPFVEAKEATFTFSLRSVWQGRPIIYRLVLVDAAVDLERQADGLRNWRLRDPEDRGPGRVRLQSLEPHRTTIRFARRDIELDITATANPSPTGTAQEADARSHPTSIKFEGELSGKKFSGDVQSGASLTLVDTQRAFALRGVASAGKTRLEVEGTIADLFDPSLIDGHMHLVGPSLAQLHPFLRASLPASRPYEFQAHIRQTPTDTSFAEVQGKMGRSDVNGEFSLVRGDQHPLLRATLHSTSAYFADFMPPGDGSLSRKPPDTREARAVGSARREPNAGQPDVSPTTFDGTRLQALDAQVSYEATRFRAPSLPMLENLRVTATLRNGVLELKPIDLRMAGGRVAGALVLDSRQELPSLHAQLNLKNVELEQLLEQFKKQTKGAGPLDGKIDLKGRGDSIAAFLSSASGSMAFAMQSGGISNLLDAKLGLNGGKMLRLLVTGDRAIGINSAQVSFDFEKGRGESKTILLDTDQTRTEGSGYIDLRTQTVDVLLRPHPKKPGVLSLHKAIRIHGPIRKPEYSLESKDATSKVGAQSQR